jgi:hypothetical protein
MNRLDKLETVELANVLTGFSEPVNSKSKWFMIKWAQKSLLTLWYDISYFSNKLWKEVKWEESVDWVLWNAYIKAIKQLQADLWIKQTWELDQVTVDFINKITDKYTSINKSKESKINTDIDTELPIVATSVTSEIESEVIPYDSKTSVNSGELTENEKKVIATDVFHRSLYKGIEGWSDVMALQEFLIDKGFLEPTFINKDGEKIGSADWKFGLWTKKALKAFQKSLWITNPDWILTVGKWKDQKTLKALKELNTNNDYNGSFTNLYWREEDIEAVEESIITPLIKIDALINLIKYSDDFYKSLEAYMDWGDRDEFISHMWSVLWWGKELTWTNIASEYFEEYLDSLDDLNTVENREKFNKELEKLLPKKENENWEEYTKRSESLWSYLARDTFLAVVFHDIPLFDIRLNFAKNIVFHGVPMDKSLALRNWVAWWMEWEPDYSKENLAQISWKDALASLWKFRSTLTAYGFSNKEIDFTLKWDLKVLSDKQKELLLTIIEYRIIPDLETLNIGWFNFVERWFDDKDNKIENILAKLTWRKHILDIKAKREFENGNIETYDVTSQKIWSHYILEVNDWWANTNSSSEHYLDKAELERLVKSYNLWDENAYTNWWSEPRFVTRSTDWTEDNSNPRRFDLFKLNNWGYIIRSFGRFKYFDHEPNQEEINLADENFDTLDIIEKGKLDNNLPLDVILASVWKVISLLKEQDTEGWFFGTEPGLREGIEMVEWKGVDGFYKEYVFINRAIEVLEKNNPELFKRFSILWVFETSEDFLKAFPASEEVHNQIIRLKDAKNEEEYVNILKEINEIQEVREYFDIVFNAHKNETWMKAWRNYRVNNISKHTWLKRVNIDPKRKFKYWEELFVLSNKLTAEEVIEKITSETTGEWWETLSISVLWNILSGLILKAWLTDVTESDLISSIWKIWEPIEILNKHDNVVNTAKTTKFSNDHITSFNKLILERWDTHVFHTVINKEVTLYKKNWEEIVLNKIYDIYIRPECNNVLIIPWFNRQLETLKNDGFNVDVPSLNTPTLPITLNLLSWLLGGWYGRWNGFWSTSGGSWSSSWSTWWGSSGF